MEKDCEIYVDPEEDEVFFGCISEKEKNLYSKLEANPKDDNRNIMVDSLELVVDEKNNKNILMNDQSGVVHKEIINDPLGLIAINQQDNSVEMEHNYSIPLKPKIDKSILSTPKSIVRADKDGGFLKVLSEIALVKAEAEGDKKAGKREDEDKENKIIQQIPEIRVTEATPERIVLSPPRSKNKQMRQFRITYKSPNEDKFDQKSHSDSEKDIKSNYDQVLRNKRKSVDLIDLDDIDNFNDNIQKGELEKNDERSAGNQESTFFKLKNPEKSGCKVLNDVTISGTKSPPEIDTPMPKPPAGLRFSKEARKIVEVLKKSTVDDTLNFKIAEVDLDSEETSFVVPEPSDFDKTEFLIEEAEKPVPKQNNFLCKTVEKECHKMSPIVPQSKLEGIKHFSERRLYHPIDNRNGIKKCVKKLPLEEKRSTSVEKTRDLAPSKIPLFGVKNTKIPLSNCIPKSVSAKMTSAKTPAVKTIPKNPKFNHIESPINAYIHNRPTALVVNVKPESKKNPMNGTPEPQTAGSSKKPTQVKSQTRSIPVPEKPSKLQSSSSIRLPFVEYKSATPYIIEKIPESRLPRLAPSVQKLIGTQSPRVLKHEGRFYLTTPRKANSAENSTIIADPNEVSVLVCQTAQKSSTIK